MLTPATSWHPAVAGGPPKAWLTEMEKFAAETVADGGTAKRLEFPNDVHPNEVLRILLESGETTFPGCDNKERHLYRSTALRHRVDVYAAAARAPS